MCRTRALFAAPTAPLPLERLLALGALVVALAACSRGGDPSVPRDAEAGDAVPSVDATLVVDAAIDAEPGALGDRCPAPAPYPTCATTVAAPAAPRTVIDLTDPAQAAAGRCDAEAPGWPGIALPEDPAAYPVLVRVSSAGFDGACTRCGESVPPFGPTRYGVAFAIPDAIHHDVRHTIAASVNAPWRIVSGGCGKACPYACLSEYLEYRPTTCLSNFGQGLGIATDASDPPVGEFLVELVATPRAFGPCCHLACP